MICGRKMTDALIANGDAQQAEKKIEYQFKKSAWKYLKKNQNIYFSTFYGIEAAIKESFLTDETKHLIKIPADQVEVTYRFK